MRLKRAEWALIRTSLLVTRNSEASNLMALKPSSRSYRMQLEKCKKLNDLLHKMDEEELIHEFQSSLAHSTS